MPWGKGNWYWYQNGPEVDIVLAPKHAKRDGLGFVKLESWPHEPRDMVWGHITLYVTCQYQLISMGQLKHRIRNFDALISIVYSE